MNQSLSLAFRNIQKRLGYSNSQMADMLSESEQVIVQLRNGTHELTRQLTEKISGIDLTMYAWVIHSDVSDLPEQVQEAMVSLIKDWKIQHPDWEIS